MELQLDQACCGNEHGAFSSSHPQMLRYACGFKIANAFWESLARRGVTMDNSRPRYAGLAALPRADGENFGGEGSFLTSLFTSLNHLVCAAGYCLFVLTPPAGARGKPNLCPARSSTGRRRPSCPAGFRWLSG